MYRADELTHDVRVDHRAAGGQPVQRPAEMVGMQDPFLEQVAGPTGACGQQPGGVLGHGELRRARRPGR
ncbi:hypothetical protein ACG83_16790 [Frankia sp. R43]|uniref:hypothetical protein n=1 Tax=Frankia sp. R43 TaxID=269536 RepID=UPI0006CA52D8|nr:hypothetical protein [Frankia sp. R43]KPM55007.1 hypothetical protein ACG83_16790 [Frankia sp. R43]